ncbi:YolD-like family protein [Bacillus cereus group sp. BY112LC]|uniref:YolD-like family protein n=1 Tax=Bacillus cereus group sp. BY112LC TaxID=3018086 RepID=UPI0022DF49D6|nr:YolD-like family protein [Bacillus cereus group sp. BY112LC]MDA1877506.1 YolD-like family protein [Bacillus cereus group sp. BY112LC]
MYERQNKVLMPILDEQKSDSINNILYCAIAENKRVCISYQIKSMFRMGEL